MKFQKGFTLIELLITIAIIGVLVSIVLTSLGPAKGKAMDIKMLVKVKQMQTALEMYYLDKGNYPPNGTFSTGSKTTTNESIAGDCENINSNYENNWTLFISEIGDYFSAAGLSISGDWPVCIFYLRGAYYQCDDKPNPKYTIIFGIESSNYQNLDEYNVQGEGGSQSRYCLYSPD